jgi:CRISPR-associated protein Csb2
MLALEIEFLTGAYRAALPDGSAAEWPPHPERVLSALTQAWGDGGERPEERDALKWLEALAPPEIEAEVLPDEAQRDAPTVYVPPNDVRGDEIAALPERRQRQARTFRAVLPRSPVVRLRWPTDASPEVRGALDALALRVASLGHSSSLVRFAFGDGGGGPAQVWAAGDAGDRPLRVPHQGRLQDLLGWYQSGRRPRTGKTMWYRGPAGPDVALRHSSFGGAEDWFVFGTRDEAGGFVPDLLGFAYVAGRARAALMAALGQKPSPTIISGHDSDGTPAQAPHLAFVPLADVGWHHSRGDLLGFAVVLPRDLKKPDRDAVITALARFAGFAGSRPAEQAGQAELRFGPGTWHLMRQAAPARASLLPERYCRSAETWASVTPVLLDRYADHDDPVEEAATIAAACRNIGLPEPVEIEIHKHSALRGAPAAYPARGVAHRPDWSFPAGSKLRLRPRRHVVLRFAERVEGPVIIGAGRYHGFGLCVALAGKEAR